MTLGEGKGYSSSSLIILRELENRLPLLKPTCPPKATKEVHAEGCPLNKVWLNGNCPSAMRAHSIVSLSLLYARACPALFKTPTQSRPTRSSANPPLPFEVCRCRTRKNAC